MDGLVWIDSVGNKFARRRLEAGGRREGEALRSRDRPVGVLRVGGRKEGDEGEPFKDIVARDVYLCIPGDAAAVDGPRVLVCVSGDGWLVWPGKRNFNSAAEWVVAEATESQSDGDDNRRWLGSRNDEKTFVWNGYVEWYSHLCATCVSAHPFVRKSVPCFFMT